MAVIGQIRVGEAANPGPWGLGAVNPTGLASKAEYFTDFEDGVYAISETHLTNSGIARFRGELKAAKSKFELKPGPPAPTKSSVWTSTGGKHTGVAFLSSFPGRSVMGTWDSSIVESARAYAAHFLVQQTWVTGGVLYGAANLSQSKVVQEYTNGILEEIIRFVAAQPGPKFVAGDFNQHPGVLEAVNKLESQGWADIQDIAFRKWSISPAMTCKEKTRKDFVILSPELHSSVKSVQVLNNIFPDHAVLVATMEDLSNPEPIPMWYVPFRIPTDGEVVQIVRNDQTPFQFKNDIEPTEAYRAVWESYEKRVDEARSVCGKHRLTSRSKGRGATLEHDFVVNKVGPIKAARQGEPNPEFGGLNLQLKRWYTQWRRLINLSRMMQKEDLSISAKQHAAALWRAILSAPGFVPSFSKWWPSRSVVIANSPYEIPNHNPSLQVVSIVCETVGKEVKNFEALLMKSKGFSQGKYSQNPNQVFRDVRDPRSLPVEVLIAKQKIKVQEVVDQGSILFEASGEIDTSEPVVGDAIPLNIVVAEEGQMWFDKEHSVVEGQELYQVKKLGTFRMLFDAFGKEWMKRWDKHKDLDESHWDTLSEFAESTMPSKPMNIRQITKEEFRAVAKSKPTAAAVGLDGVSCQDIVHMPDSHLESLLEIIDHAETTGQWPCQMLQGAVHSLQKTPNASTVGEYRPITILSAVYRCWGTLRGRQLLSHLSQFAPEFLHGSVAGKAAVSMWYQIQGRVECSQIDGVVSTGAILDIIKAFNCLPRWPIIRTAVAMGVHQRILKPWLGFITMLQRRFIIRQACGPGLLSSTGFAEGCPLSVGAMLLTNLILHRYFTIACPSVHLWSYVDNWELIAESTEQLQDSIGIISRFATLADIQIDQAKSLVWATEGEERKKLKELGHQVTKNVRDLGGHMQFSRQQTNGTVKKKCLELGSLWRRLACSAAPLRCKTRVVRVKAWPRALHAAAGVNIGDHIYESLRAGAFRGCRLQKAGASSKIYWSLCNHCAHDPEGFSLMSSLRTFRKQVESFWVGPYLDIITNTPSKQRCPGPLGVLVSRLENIGWTHVRDSLFQDQWGLAIHLSDTNWKEVQVRACEAFQLNVGQQMTVRHGFEGLQDVNASLTASCMKKFDTEEQGLLRALLVGSFMTADQYGVVQHLEENDRVCKFCGEKDSLQHRHWHCKHTQPSRDKVDFDISKFLAEYPPCMVERGWALLPPDLAEFRRQLQKIPDTTGEFFVGEACPKCIDIFTDGAGREPKLQQARIVGWAWCVALSPWTDHFAVGAEGGVPGIWQTVLRAEITAVISAIRFVIKNNKEARIWCDNQQVVDTVRAIQAGKSVDKSQNDHDLWGVVQALFESGGARVQIYKVFSHQPTDLTELENWICKGNEAADFAANRAVDNLPPKVKDLHVSVSKWITKYSATYISMLQHFVRVGKLSVVVDSKPEGKQETKQPEPEVELDVKEVVAFARKGLAPSLTSDKLELWLDWFDNIVDVKAPVRWVSWYELLILFQIQTGCIGMKCHNVTWGNHRHWQVMEHVDLFDFRKMTKDLAQFGRNIIVHRYPQWKVTQHRPTSHRFHLWCNSLPIRFDQTAQMTVDQWLEEVGCGGPFKKASELSVIPSVQSCSVVP